MSYKVFVKHSGNWRKVDYGDEFRTLSKAIDYMDAVWEANHMPSECYWTGREFKEDPILVRPTKED